MYLVASKRFCNFRILVAKYIPWLPETNVYCYLRCILRVVVEVFSACAKVISKNVGSGLAYDISLVNTSFCYCRDKSPLHLPVSTAAACCLQAWLLQRSAHRGEFRQLASGSRNEPGGSCVGKWRGKRRGWRGEQRGVGVEGGVREMNGEGKGGRRWGMGGRKKGSRWVRGKGGVRSGRGRGATSLEN